jgi:hypothetical protein
LPRAKCYPKSAVGVGALLQWLTSTIESKKSDSPGHEGGDRGRGYHFAHDSLTVSAAVFAY